MRYICLLLLIAACSSGPRRPTTWVNLGWAKTSVQQAEAECWAEIQRPNGIPGFDLCMKAKGWERR